MMIRFFLFLLLGLSVSCGVQSIPETKTEAQAALFDRIKLYKQRADLIPSYVLLIKRHASHEKKAISELTLARANATRVKLGSPPLDPEKVSKYLQAQEELSQAVVSSLAVAERYPSLQSDESFRHLSERFRAAESLMLAANKKHMELLQSFNDLIQKFPSNVTNQLLFGHKEMASWDLKEQADVVLESEPPPQ